MVRVLFSVFSLLVILGCQNSSPSTTEGHAHHAEAEAPKTPADSVYTQVMDVHDLVMPKMGKVRGAQKRAQLLIDSIAALPVNSARALASYKKELETLSTDPWRNPHS